MSDNIYENTVETAQPYPMEENHFKKYLKLSTKKYYN